MIHLQDYLKKHHKNLLNIYFTAGYPNLEDTAKIALSLQEAGVNLLEIGFPYSDPIADGEIIQQSSAKALKNGIHIQKIFDQLATIKEKIEIPMIAMGYYNQFLQFGAERFLQECNRVGISACIFPDLPLDYYQKKYQKLFDQYNILALFLISPKTSTSRIITLAEASRGFLYLVSSSSTTGNTTHVNVSQTAYFEKVKQLVPNIPILIGFGIHDTKSYQEACNHSNGAIIGSAFIKAISEGNLKENINRFIQTIRG